MLYIHDVWVNWFESEENSYNVCYFHEWRKEDKIDLLDRVPLLYIKEDLYHHVENNMHEVPKALLELIYKQAYMRRGQKKEVIDYACVITDGNEIIAFDTIGYSIPVRKSRLIPRQEEMVFDMIKNTKPKKLPFKKELYEKKHHILSMAPEYIHGLTRRERQLKQLLMMSLDQLKTEGNVEELRYWLTEWNPKKYPFIRSMNKEQVWSELYHGVKMGWNGAHEELCVKLIKGQPFLEQIWEVENKQGTISVRQKSRNQ